MGMYPTRYPKFDDYVTYGIGDESYLSEIQQLAKNEVYHTKPDFSVNRLDQKTDLLLRVDKANCPRFGFALNLAEENKEYQKIGNYFYDNYHTQFEELIQEQVSSIKEMSKRCSYIEWAILAGLELKFKPSDLDMGYCMALGDYKMYALSYGLPEIWKLSAYNFLKQL